MKRLVLLAATLLFAVPAVAGNAAGAEPLLYAPLPADQSKYTFADVYRLTVGATAPGAPMAEWPRSAPAAGAAFQGPFSEFQVRTVAEGAPVQAAYLFSTASVSRPEGLGLFLAGLAAVLWVAYRRIGYSIRG
jgi:hypothetical protein